MKRGNKERRENLIVFSFLTYMALGMTSCVGGEERHNDTLSVGEIIMSENTLTVRQSGTPTLISDTALSIPSYVWTSDWMKAYKKFMKKHPYGPWVSPASPFDYDSACFAYIDGDTIPEIVFFASGVSQSTTILTYNGRNVNLWSSWRQSVVWHSGTGWILNDDGIHGHYWERYFHLQDGVFTNVLTYEVYEQNAKYNHILKEMDPYMYSWCIFYGDTVCYRKTDTVYYGQECPFYVTRQKGFSQTHDIAMYSEMPLALIGTFNARVFLSKLYNKKQTQI